MATSNEAERLNNERKAMIDAVNCKYKIAVCRDGTAYDVSEQGKSLPWMLLNCILDSIDPPSKRKDCSIPNHHKMKGYCKSVVMTPTTAVAKCDIMNVLSNMVFEKMIRFRESLTQCAEMGISCELLSGIRKLNSNRYELFMKRGKNNGIDAISMIVTQILNDIMEAVVVKKHPFRNHPFDYSKDIDTITECMIKHANFHASISGRECADFVFENHAIIVTFDAVEAQDPHIDLDDVSSYQFGFVMSNNTPPTIHYMSTEGKQYLKIDQSLTAIWSEISEPLSRTIWGNKDCQNLLNKYGKVLTRQRKMDGPDHVVVSVGSLFSLPSREVHGGPKSRAPRAIMFFTGRPPTGATSYNDEVQYCITALIGDLLLHTWLQLLPDQREFMLTLWWQEGIKHDRNGLFHIVHTHLKRMGEAIKAAKDEEQRRKWISDMASSIVWDDKEGNEKWDLPVSEWPRKRKSPVIRKPKTKKKGASKRK